MNKQFYVKMNEKAVLDLQGDDMIVWAKDEQTARKKAASLLRDSGKYSVAAKWESAGSVVEFVEHRTAKQILIDNIHEQMGAVGDIIHNSADETVKDILEKAYNEMLDYVVTAY